MDFCVPRREWGVVLPCRGSWLGIYNGESQRTFQANLTNVRLLGKLVYFLQLPDNKKKRERGLSRLIFETKKTEQAVTFPAEYCWTFKFQDFAVTDRLKYKLEVERLVWVVSDAAKYPISMLALC